MHELTIWLALGFFGGGPDVNGYSNPGTLLAGVTWSLQVEWRFYLSLLVTCFIARSQGRFIYVIILPLILLLPLVAMHHLSRFVPYGYLIIGMFCASLERDGLLLITLDWVSSSALILLLVIDFALFSSAYEATPMLLTGLCFYLYQPTRPVTLRGIPNLLAL